ncbi:hypothetical protein OHT59_01310 [Streptomyces sp. NBC_00243]|uniref:hypothetical protein n=1 Tax=Streptomyces sp. NBC_00243 TaxID=2975688 RepID=UPI002DD9F0DF|nr:hypothetical protein [Streptomyces sp. NBC_00243]WRZ26227.1 hypothetical protein OHT59_01310 [Streptomyces sp. NBC_00243]
MTDPAPASLPTPPYYAVVFTAVRTAGDNGYGEADERLMKLATTAGAALSLFQPQVRRGEGRRRPSPRP